MDVLYITAYKVKLYTYRINIETLITIHAYQISDTAKVKLFVKLLSEEPEDPLVTCDLAYVPHHCSSSPPPLLTQYCTWPLIVSRNKVIAGLCSVTRHLIKGSDRRDLLGFREACLMACSESSIWTRFCEVDAISMAKNVMRNAYCDGTKYSIPEDVARFEYHLSKPVRMHNVYKFAREKNNDKDITSSIPLENLNLEHSYGEGTSMTLSDVILYPCFRIFFQRYPFSLIQDKIPLVVEWYDKMKASCLPVLEFEAPINESEMTEVVCPDFVKHSLYTSDRTRYRPEKRIYTKQIDIEGAINQLEILEDEIVNEFIPFGSDIGFSWSDVPIEANPNGGALPAKRADRKCEQLENLAKAMLKLAAGKNYTIVDFCSGSGHVGILLAVLLPNCKILLVENKEKSLTRAQDRIDKLGLFNVFIVQSNLDYFVGNFDVGVALHACGVATDLVMETCIRNRAHFVVCPCCYGNVKDCHHLTYPRSSRFQKLDLGYKNYLSLAHAADQTHDVANAKTPQGYFCMDVVDTDRRFHAESYGYRVHLGKLQPTTCTNKNNLLVGVFSSKR